MTTTKTPKQIILDAIAAATGQRCGTVTYDRAARDWRVTGVFAADAGAIAAELRGHGFARKSSASGLYFERAAN
jgi:hypothetical protein